MKKIFSLRFKLLTWFITLILAFVVFILLFTAYFLKPYYIKSQKDLFVTLSQHLNNSSMESSDILTQEINRSERKDGYSIGLYNTDNTMIYSTFNDSMSIVGRPPGSPGGPPGFYSSVPPPKVDLQIDPVILVKLNSAENGYLFLRENDPFLKTTLIHMFSKMPDGTLLQISRPLESIDQSISIALRFIILAGILSLILGSIISLFLSERFTRPIKEMKSIAVSMSRLNFNRKYLVTTKDEIGELGSSINSLSDQLSRSITDLKEMNQSLVVDIEQKERINEMRKEFISSISHELRTPISLIKGYAEGLLDNIMEDKEGRTEYCEVIIDESVKMEKHVNDLLELSHLESGNSQADLSVFNITELISKTLKKFERRFDEEDVTYSFHETRSFSVSADKYRAEQILINYLNNALNHIDGEKHIHVLMAVTDNNKIRVKVCNTGRHIPDESLDKIWDTYYKVDKARTRKYGGYGLGLSIVKAIQQQHGNDYGVENAKDSVAFWFDLTAVG